MTTKVALTLCALSLLMSTTASAAISDKLKDRIEEAATVVNARAVGGERLGALRDRQIGQSFRHLADQDIDRLRRLHLLAIIEKGIEARVACFGVLDRGAHERRWEHRARRQGNRLAGGLAVTALALAIVADRRLAFPLAGDLSIGRAAMVELQLLAVAALGHLRLLLAGDGAAARSGVFGVPTFVADGVATFVRFMERGRVEDLLRVLDLLDWDGLNEFKRTRIPR